MSPKKKAKIFTYTVYVLFAIVMCGLAWVGYDLFTGM